MRSVEQEATSRVIPLNLGAIHVVDDPWPVHGFALLHDTLGVILIDTGCGGPEALLREYRAVNRTVADALAEHGLSPADVRMVINTHLHFDHCGQNVAFPHAAMHVQRAEHERVRRENDDVARWLEASDVRFELLDGDVTLADDLRIIAAPGHTSGHQCVVLEGPTRTELFIGDAAFRRSVWEGDETLAPGQADDVAAWRSTLAALRGLEPKTVHFCHDD